MTVLLVWIGCFSDADAADPVSPMQMGVIGLNTVPTARMDQAGDIRIGASVSDPYMHGFFGVQIMDPLYVQIRQSAEVPNLTSSARDLFPGVDAKLRLMEEGRIKPAVVIGLQSATGHKRTAGEYLAFSKRYKSFDFTGGVGWGRYGSAGHFKNPLRLFGSHFTDNRPLDGEEPNSVEDWFTGERVGLFGGVEYYTPLKGLSLKLDYGADEYSAERISDAGFDAPARWSAGLNYQPVPWADLSLGILGGDKVMARMNFNGMAANWRDQQTYLPVIPSLKNSEERGQIDFDGIIETDEDFAKRLIKAAESYGVRFHSIAHDDEAVQVHVELDPALSTPLQVKRAAYIVANETPRSLKIIRITPTTQNVTTRTVTLHRNDVEALPEYRTSAAELWQHTTLESIKRPFHHRFRTGHNWLKYPKSFELELENQFSLSEKDSGHLRRSSLLAGFKGLNAFGVASTTGVVRVNLHDNLERLEKVRLPRLLPVRSNVNDFTDQRVTLDKFYTTLAYSPNSNWHGMLRTGFLEEMYMGFGGELLYRPFDKRFAVGAELWQAFKRDADERFHLGVTGDSLLTGHVNAWYDIPKHDVTVKASAGRYLAEDVGGTLSLSKVFKNGASLEAFASVTNRSDFNLFGGVTSGHHGIRFRMPLGGFKYAPRNSAITTRIEPFGRDIAQKIQSDESLYDMTNPMSLNHIQRHWGDMNE